MPMIIILKKSLTLKNNYDIINKFISEKYLSNYINNGWKKGWKKEDLIVLQVDKGDF